MLLKTRTYLDLREYLRANTHIPTQLFTNLLKHSRKHILRIIRTWTYVHTLSQIQTLKYIHLRIQTYKIFTCAHSIIHKDTKTWLHIHVTRTHTNTQTYTHTHNYAHTCAHTHSHTNIGILLHIFIVHAKIIIVYYLKMQV